MTRYLRMLALLVALALLPATSLSAQGVNLLTDPGFEGAEYVLISIDPFDGTTFSVPVGWSGGVIRSPSTESWMNVQPTGFPHFGPFLWSGGRSLHIARGFGTFTAYVYQQVSVQPGSPLQAGVYAYIENSVGSLVRVGIDPNGGANPFDPAVVWSDWSGNLNGWNTPAITSRANGPVATIFLYATQSQPANPNGVYWDDAYLIGIPGDGTITAGGGDAPAPAGQFVSPTANVFVRRGPGLNFPRIGGANVGDALPLLGEEGEWFAVDFNGQTGYISQRFAERSGSAGSGGGANVPVVDALQFTVNYALRMRTAPNTSAEELAIIPFTTVVRAIGRSSDNAWVQVEYAGQVGWVAARFGRLSGSIFSLAVR